MSGIFGDGQRGGIFGAKVDPLLVAELERRAVEKRQMARGLESAAAADTTIGSRALDWWNNSTLARMADPRTSPLGPAAVARMFFDPAGEAGRQVETGRQLAEPFTQFNDPNVSPVKQGADLALTVMGGSSVVPTAANELRMGIKAYHGSPHDFAPEPGYPLGRFRSDKIGTGEGNQAFGYGHYTAEREGVAQEYRDKLTHRNFINEAQDPRKVGEALFDVEARDGGLIDGKIPFGPTRGLKTREQIADMFASGEASAFDLRPAMQKKINEFMKPPGKMYEVDIAAEPEHFLDWDKPLSEQPQAIQDAMVTPEGQALSDKLDAVIVEKNALARDRDPKTNMMRNEKRWHELAREADRLQGELSKVVTADMKGGYAQLVLGGGEASSRRLREAGIPGIKYLDQGSRGAGTGTSNYVVFDDKLISILRKYGLPISVAGLATLSQLHPEEAQAAQQKGKR